MEYFTDVTVITNNMYKQIMLYVIDRRPFSYNYGGAADKAHCRPFNPMENSKSPDTGNWMLYEATCGARTCMAVATV